MIINMFSRMRFFSTLLALSAAAGLGAIGGPQARVAYSDALNAGAERLAAGDFEAAEQFFARAGALNLSSLRPRILRAQALNGLARFDDAAKLLERTARYAQPDRQPEFFVIWAESEIGRQDAAHAITLLEPVLKINPADARAQRLKGKALLMTGDEAGGLAALQEAVRLAPGDPRGPELLARYYLDRGQPAKALELLRTLQTTMGGADARTSAALAAAEGALGDPHAAAAALLARGPEARAEMTALYGRVPAPENCPDSPITPIQLVACGRFDAARTSLSLLSVLTRDDALLLARACLWLDDAKCAAAEMRRAAGLDPALAEGLERLAARLVPPPPAPAPPSTFAPAPGK